MKILKDANITKGTRVLVRADLDVPIKDGQIMEAYLLESGLPTLKYLQDKQATIIIMGHLGRPDGKVVDDLSTKHLIPFYNEHLGEGTYELLENLRFDSREEANDPEFAKELATKADIYINECFSASHRAHASITGVAQLLPAYAGLRLEKEVTTLEKVLKDPVRPLIAVVGGVKVETKKPVIAKFIQIADMILVGGKLGTNWNAEIPDNMKIPRDYGELGRDIGPRTIGIYTEILSRAKTVIWSGPMGNYEEEKFMHGTKEIAKAIIASKAFSVVGGGDTVAALQKINLADKFSFVSTGGGAMLDFLAYGNLPGLEVLDYHG
jgi:phosphoglycerate kinase